jgi:hypothetical protein
VLFVYSWKNGAFVKSIYTVIVAVRKES